MSVSTDHYYSGGILNSDTLPEKVKPRSYKYDRLIETTINDPYWRDKVKARKDASHYYLRDELDLQRGNPILHSYSTDMKGKSPNRHTVYYMQMLDITGISSTPISRSWDYKSELANATNVCLSKSKNKLESYANQINFLIDLGEYKETINMIKRVRGFIADWLRAIWDLRKMDPVALIRMISETWLAFNFGLRPLIDDLNVAIENLTLAVGYPDVRVINSGAPLVTYTGKFKPGSLWNMQSGDVGFLLSGRYTVSASVEHKARAYFEMELEDKWTYLRQLGLDGKSILINSPSTIWELIPFSWVLDYFFSIGEFLEDISYSPPGKAICSNLIYNVDVQFYWDIKVNIPKNRNVRDFISPFVNGGSQFYGRRTIKERVPVSLLPYRSVAFKMTEQIGDHADSKLANLVAVLIQLLSGTKTQMHYRT